MSDRVEFKELITFLWKGIGVQVLQQMYDKPKRNVSILVSDTQLVKMLTSYGELATVSSGQSSIGIVCSSASYSQIKIRKFMKEGLSHVHYTLHISGEPGVFTFKPEYTQTPGCRNALTFSILLFKALRKAFVKSDKLNFSPIGMGKLPVAKKPVVVYIGTVGSPLFSVSNYIIGDVILLSAFKMEHNAHITIDMLNKCTRIHKDIIPRLNVVFNNNYYANTQQTTENRTATVDVSLSLPTKRVHSYHIQGSFTNFNRALMYNQAIASLLLTGHALVKGGYKVLTEGVKLESLRIEQLQGLHSRWDEATLNEITSHDIREAMPTDIHESLDLFTRTVLSPRTNF